mgnify:FL=1
MPATGSRESSKPVRTWRYKAYFYVMDACLVFAGLGLIDHFVDPYEPETAPAWYFVYGGLFLAFNTIVPLFLMLASFMRDDYAEGLFRRTLQVLAYGAAVVPPIVMIVPWLLAGLFIMTEARAPGFYREFYAAFYDGAVPPATVLGRVWLAFMLSFVGTFQFLRWKDSK